MNIAKTLVSIFQISIANHLTFNNPRMMDCHSIDKIRINVTVCVKILRDCHLETGRSETLKILRPADIS